MLSEAISMNPMNAALNARGPGPATLKVAVIGPDRHHERMSVASAKSKRIKLHLHEA